MDGSQRTEEETGAKDAVASAYPRPFYTAVAPVNPK